jgi:mono/diheme cytochrome c family protein
LCLLLAACGGAFARKIAPPAKSLPEKLPADPREADKVAKDAFRNLTFFAEGRGMAMTPGLVGSYKLVSWTGAFDGMMRDRWGLIMEDRIPIGLTEVSYQGMRIGAIGCAMCHTGRAAGQTIVGLGNKTFDIVQLATQLRRIQRRYVAVTFASSERREVEAAALEFVERIADRDRGNLTRGMVPVSFVFGWFFRMAGEEPPADMHRAAVKVPALWGYGAKRDAGQFCDGYGDGRVPGWAVQVELTAGQKPETTRQYLSKIAAAEELFAAFLPPAYPFEHDRGAAVKGAEVFAEHCGRCHGTYERDLRGLPIFQEPRLIDIDRVGTDRDRLDARSEALDRHVENSPLNDLIRHRSPPPGYFAPRLDGIWSRYPYLHNGSVPNIAALLAPPAERPAVFSLVNAGERDRFDESKLGLTLPNDLERTRLKHSGEKGDRSVYDTRRTGHSNAGHEFGTDLDDAEKSALIEYLKTL